LTTEAIRTRPYPRPYPKDKNNKMKTRLTKQPVGWHYHNMGMSAESILFKYNSYGHPEDSSLVNRYGYNLTSSTKEEGIGMVLKEKDDDCKYRKQLIDEENYNLILPVLLQNYNNPYKDWFFQPDEYYSYFKKTAINQINMG
jgi:hypothetical protein